MTKTKNTSFHVDQIITIAPGSARQFVVLAVDDLSDDMLYVEPVDAREDEKARWIFTTYVRPMAEQEDATE